MRIKSFAGYLLVFAVTLLIGFTPIYFGAHPIPNVPDEFAYLLASDTFAHGRLTNPPLPKPEYFQTFHELTRPTYSSKYPPGQGLTLAAGQVFGDPIYGAIVTTGLACVAVMWMARAWLPLRWALFAGLMSSLHPLIRYWAQSYWGGSLGMLGGALVAGAVLRAARRPRWTSAVVLAVGYAVLMNMRPMEGTVFTLLCLGYLLMQWRRAAVGLRSALRFVAVAAVAFLPFFAWTLYFNYRVTGSLTTTPYLLYAEHYQGVPSLLFQKPWPNYPDLNERMAHYRDAVDGEEYRSQTTLHGFIVATGKKIVALWTQWVEWIRLPLLLPILWSLGRRRMRWAVAFTLVPILVQLSITPWLRWHYLSPGIGMFFLLLAMTARQLSGKVWGRILVGVVLAYSAYRIGGLVHIEIVTTHPPGWARANLIEQLKQVPGNHVVVVTYEPGPQQVFEWVYNDADLNSQRVIFAFDRGPQTVADLRTLFPDRQYWSLKLSDFHFDLQPILQNR